MKAIIETEDGNEIEFKYPFAIRIVNDRDDLIMEIYTNGEHGLRITKRVVKYENVEIYDDGFLE